MTQPTPRPAMTMRQIRESLGHVQPDEPEVIVSVTRYTVSVLTADDINHRYFALSVELTPRGWIVTDGHSGYDADGTAHHGETRWHPFADYDDALAVARRLAPGLTVNGRTASEVLQGTQEPTTAPLDASHGPAGDRDGETGTEGAAGRVGDSGTAIADRLEAVLAERFTELGNPFSRMSINFQGPDGWPASKEVGPHDVAEVLRELLAATTEDLAAADNPTRLRWGLDDVMWGDDDSVIVLMSGPDLEPYRLELDPERAAVLRRNLAGPPAEETHIVADDSSDPEHVDDCPGCAPAAEEA